MPTIVTTGAMSARAFGAFRTYLSSAINFLELRSFGGYNTNNSTVDSAYNIYVTGYDGSNKIPIEKIDLTGVTTSFSKTVTGGTIGNCCYSYVSSGACVDVDSSGNIYVGGSAGAGNGGCRAYGAVNAYNSSGTLLWQVTIDSGSADGSIVQGIKYNPVNGYVYVVTQFGFSSFGFCALMASTGALIYNRVMSGTVGAPQFGSTIYTASNNMAIDSSGYVYVCYSTATVYQGDTVGYLKIDTGFNIQQLSVVTGLVSNCNYSQCIALDSSGNIYIGTMGVTNYSKAIVIKFNSSGTYLWNASVSKTFNTLGFQAITTDSSGNVYAAGGNAGGQIGGAESFILKFNSSGTIQYQRNINATNSLISGLNIGPSNSIYFSGNWSTNAKGLVGNVPTDGSKTGTYTVGATSVIYAASSYTISSEAFTQPTITRSFSGAATYATSTYATGSFTPTVSRAVI